MNTLLDSPATSVATNGKAEKATKVNYESFSSTPDDLTALSGAAEVLRQCAWQIGEQRATDRFVPTDNHVALAQVTPNQGFAHWRIKHEWIDGISRRRSHDWH